MNHPTRDHRINPNGVVIALAVLLSVLILVAAGHWPAALAVLGVYVTLLILAEFG